MDMVEWSALLQAGLIACQGFFVLRIKSYLSSFSQREGEIDAINANIEKVLRFQELQAERVKTIEATISGGLWEAQERWRLKARIYEEVLNALAELRKPFDLWPEVGIGKLPEDAWRKASHAMARLQGPSELAALWIHDEEVVKNLRSIGKAMDAIFDGGDSDVGYGESVCKMVDRIRERLLESARVELRLDLGSPGSPSPRPGAGD